MDHLHKLSRQVRQHLLFVLAANNIILLSGWWLGSQVYQIEPVTLLITLCGTAITMTILFAILSTKYLTEPIRMLWQAILHITPNAPINVAAPKPERARLGRDLVVSLTRQIYQLASGAESISSNTSQPQTDLHTNAIANLLPLPLFVLDTTQTVLFANEPALSYLELSESDIVGKNLYSVLDMSFPNENTFDAWLTHAKSSTVTANKTWERVRFKPADQSTPHQFDLAAHYSKANPSRYETLLILFDHTQQYSQDDQAMSFVALSVHELRTPLTLLRGYIEAFEEELGGQLTGELADFMHKMDASAQQLAAFVNNILNVARIEGDQLTLQLHEENWANEITTAIHDLSLRANVRDITIETHVAEDLPSVAIDRVSIYEVISNLIDNAIKYSGTSKKIIVKSSLTKDGFVETTIQDFGVGIPESVMPNLFNKFYRNHRNRAQIGGTGLGLYLSKAIIAAHSGNIWVRSKEGEGTIFGFTILPYAKLADELKNKDNNDIVRSPHGWIKNHSLYRR